MESNHHSFCELVPLYALDILDPSERQLVEEQIAEYPELEAELVEFQTSVAAIAYSTPTVSMAADLKNRLFAKIGVELPEPSPPCETIPAIIVPNLVIRNQDLDWQPYRIPGVLLAQLHIDPVKREASCLLRAEAGVCYPLHRHTGIEEIFMLEGDLIIGEEIYGKGDYIRSMPGSVHAPQTRGGCMFFVHTSLDDEYPEH